MHDTQQLLFVLFSFVYLRAWKRSLCSPEEGRVLWVKVEGQVRASTSGGFPVPVCCPLFLVFSSALPRAGIPGRLALFLNEAQNDFSRCRLRTWSFITPALSLDGGSPKQALGTSSPGILFFMPSGPDLCSLFQVQESDCAIQ